MLCLTSIEEWFSSPPFLGIHDDVNKGHQDEGKAASDEHIRQGPENKLMNLCTFKNIDICSVYSEKDLY